MKISEIFLSLQGEGKYTGVPTIFIRFFGCPVGCEYCDSRYTWDSKSTGFGFKDLTLEEVMEEVTNLASKDKAIICITGGDPDFVPDSEMLPLIDSLFLSGYKVTMETSGSRSQLRYMLYDAALVSRYEDTPKVDCIVMDVKGPSAKTKFTGDAYAQFIKDLRQQDQAKFLIADEEDYDYMLYVLATFKPVCEILLSPVMSKDWNSNKERMGWLANRILRMPEELKIRVRMNFQLHKFIWGDARGK